MGTLARVHARLWADLAAVGQLGGAFGATRSFSMRWPIRLIRSTRNKSNGPAANLTPKSLIRPASVRCSASLHTIVRLSMIRVSGGGVRLIDAVDERLWPCLYGYCWPTMRDSVQCHGKYLP